MPYLAEPVAEVLVHVILLMVTVTPVGFLVIKDGNVRYLGVPEPAQSSVDRIIEKAPDLMDQVSGLLQKAKEKKTAE